MKPPELRIVTLILLVVLGASEALLAHNVLYTEGEIIQGLYWILVWFNLPLLAIALWEPRWGLWGGLTLAALLLPWQTSANRKVAQIHEEVIHIIRFVESKQETNGDYPVTLADYEYRRDWVARHIAYEAEDGAYQLAYFANDDSISYWYTPESGFDYYPD